MNVPSIFVSAETRGGAMPAGPDDNSWAVTECTDAELADGAGAPAWSAAGPPGDGGRAVVSGAVGAAHAPHRRETAQDGGLSRPGSGGAAAGRR
jgi:hypothetical protein